MCNNSATALLGIARHLPRDSPDGSSRFDGPDGRRRRLRVRVTGDRVREQPLSSELVEILNREREMAEDPGGWIFPNSKVCFRSHRGHEDHLLTRSHPGRPEPQGGRPPHHAAHSKHQSGGDRSRHPDYPGILRPPEPNDGDALYAGPRSARQSCRGRDGEGENKSRTNRANEEPRFLTPLHRIYTRSHPDCTAHQPNLLKNMVEPGRLELPTFALRTRRSPN